MEHVQNIKDHSTSLKTLYSKLKDDCSSEDNEGKANLIYECLCEISKIRIDLSGDIDKLEEDLREKRAHYLEKVSLW